MGWGLWAEALVRSMLFLTKENDFAGEEQAITLQEVKDACATM